MANYIDLDASEEDHYQLTHVVPKAQQIKQDLKTVKGGITVYIEQDKQKTPIQIKANATIKELKEKYAKSVSTALTFKFIGMVLKDEKTLKDYTISDNDTINCTIDKTKIDASQYVKLKLRFENESHSFKICPIDKLEKLFDKYAQKIGKDVNRLKFIFDGYVISGDETCETLELENNFIIDVQAI